MRGPERVAAIIPAFEAARSVAGVVERTLGRLGPVVFVVDDGSSDGTGAVAAAAGARVLTHERNLGKGTALRTAFRTVFAEGFDAAVTIDADGQHLPEEVPVLLAAAQGGADLVLGSRDALFAEMSPLRRTSNRLSSLAISFAAGRRVLDVQTGFRLYTRRLIDAVGFPPGRFEAESAILVLAARAGFVISIAPVRLGFADGRCTSHYRPLADSLRIARAVVQARFRRRRFPLDRPAAGLRE